MKLKKVINWPLRHQIGFSTTPPPPTFNPIFIKKIFLLEANMEMELTENGSETILNKKNSIGIILILNK